jgi:hypothetical protein
MDNGSSGFFTLTELQERLNVKDREHLLQSLRDKGIPVSPFGREVFIDSVDFNEYLRQHKQVGVRTTRKRNAS